MAKKLSICIATFNRANFIGETLDSIVGQLEPGVEIVIVDGASSDKTAEVIEGYRSKCADIRYHREPINSGIDQDYDKAVGYASGEYCWLMTDDDVLCPGAITKVLSAIESGSKLIVANWQVRNADFSSVLIERNLKILRDVQYDRVETERFFVEAGHHLSFIGCVIIKRALWAARDRASYYGTLFVHVGVILQTPPIDEIRVIADPIVVIRYGNAMWTPRGFEIWMFKWPGLVWSFPMFSPEAKKKICAREPWRNVRNLLIYRATGAYSTAEFKRLLLPRMGARQRYFAYLISVFPGGLVNLVAAIAAIFTRASRMARYDLTRSGHAGPISRMLLRAFSG